MSLLVLILLFSTQLFEMTSSFPLPLQVGFTPFSTRPPIQIGFKVGFIGVGKISTSLATGLLSLKTSSRVEKLILSPRNLEKAKAIRNSAKNSEKVFICESNQQVIDESDVVFLCLLPDVAKSVLPGLRFRKDQLILSEY